MGENVKKETVDYLPLGSVVILKGGVQKVVVIARGLLSDGRQYQSVVYGITI